MSRSVFLKSYRIHVLLLAGLLALAASEVCSLLSWSVERRTTKRSIDSVPVTADGFRACGCETACPCTASKYSGMDCCSPEECRCARPKDPSARQLAALERSHAWEAGTAAVGTPRTGPFERACGCRRRGKHWPP